MESLHTISAALQRIPVSRSKLYVMLKNGEVRSVKVGGRRLIPESAITEFVQRVEGDQANAPWSA